MVKLLSKDKLILVWGRMKAKARKNIWRKKEDLDLVNWTTDSSTLGEFAEQMKCQVRPRWCSSQARWLWDFEEIWQNRLSIEAMFRSILLLWWTCLDFLVVVWKRLDKDISSASVTWPSIDRGSIFTQRLSLLPLVFQRPALGTPLPQFVYVWDGCEIQNYQETTPI